MKKISIKITTHFNDKKPFVVYKKPNENCITGIFQKENTLQTTISFKESGFVFAPFDDKNPAILIPYNASEVIEEFVDEENNNFKTLEYKIDTLSKQFHIDLVKKGIKSIENNEFIKVVLSRKEVVEIDEVNLVELYKKLVQKYPNAFVYLWFHPQVGLWFGATPETLVKLKGNQFSTMSLAGTQVYNNTEKVIWQQKEIDEQYFVTQFIESQLSKISTSLKIGDTKTAKAGVLLHLKTDIEGVVLDDDASLKKLIKALHPTPAVCGLPRESAKQFILQHEKYDRAFYTGFLGEINTSKTNTSELFVNLRCMVMKAKSVCIFVGGGITKESDPEKEWLETVAKTNIMKNVLN